MLGGLHTKGPVFSGTIWEDAILQSRAGRPKEALIFLVHASIKGQSLFFSSEFFKVRHSSCRRFDLSIPIMKEQCRLDSTRISSNFTLPRNGRLKRVHNGFLVLGTMSYHP